MKKEILKLNDSLYYRDNKYGMSLLIRARISMFRLFMEQMIPNRNSKIIDIGVSDEENDGANYLEKSYPWPSQITCAGIGNGEVLIKSYPGVSFCNIQPNQPLPFPDDYFDISYSNAVIEHVGGQVERKKFILESIRVAKATFIAFPNRWFPVEHHTSLPLLHFNPCLFRRLIGGTRYDDWSNSAQLDFIDRRSILAEWPTLDKPRVITTGIALGPFSSNIAVIYKKPIFGC